MKTLLPKFPGQLRKNDAFFIYGAAQKKPFGFVYKQKSIEVVHGPSCRVNEEVFVSKCEEDSVAVIERRGGGGTVVLSPGMLVTIVVGEKRGKENAVDIFRRVHDAVIPALHEAGVTDAAHEGISDLAINGKKVLGSSLYMGSNMPFYYYQSSLMVSNNLTLLSRYLCHPPREPDYRKGRDHRQFCTTLCESGLRVSISELSELIESSLKKYSL
jgi:lipoate-protein ligase A